MSQKWGPLQIGQKLLFVNRDENLDRLNLDDHLILDNQVSPESDIDPNRPVDNRDWLLAHRPESTLSKFIGEHCLVNRFQ